MGPTDDKHEDGQDDAPAERDIVLRWLEPAAFRRGEPGRPGAWRGRIASALLLGGAVWLILGSPLMDVRWPLWQTMAVAAGVGVGTVASVVWVFSRLPAQVVISSKGVHRFVPHPTSFAISFWSWDVIRRVRVEPWPRGSGAGLGLYSKKKKLLGRVGLGADADVPGIVEVFARHDLAVDLEKSA